MFIPRPYLWGGGGRRPSGAESLKGALPPGFRDPLAMCSGGDQSAPMPPHEGGPIHRRAAPGRWAGPEGGGGGVGTDRHFRCGPLSPGLRRGSPGLPGAIPAEPFAQPLRPSTALGSAPAQPHAAPLAQPLRPPVARVLGFEMQMLARMVGVTASSIGMDHLGFMGAKRRPMTTAKVLCGRGCPTRPRRSTGLMGPAKAP